MAFPTHDPRHTFSSGRYRVFRSPAPAFRLEQSDRPKFVIRPEVYVRTQDRPRNTDPAFHSRHDLTLERAPIQPVDAGRREPVDLPIRAHLKPEIQRPPLRHGHPVSEGPCLRVKHEQLRPPASRHRPK